MARQKGFGQYGKPNYGQAARIIAKFGGERALANLLTESGYKIDRISVYRWTYARPAGTDGLIPQKQRPRIEAIARYQGVLLQPKDWEAERIRYDGDEKPEGITRAIPPGAVSLADLFG